GNARRNIGRLPAVSTSATRMGDLVSEIISQDSPTSCIQDPTLDATEAIQSARKIGSRRRPPRRAAHPGITSRLTLLNLNNSLSALSHTYDPTAAGRSFYRRVTLAVRSYLYRAALSYSLLGSAL